MPKNVKFMHEVMKETSTKFLTSSEAVGKLLLKKKRKNHPDVHMLTILLI